MKRPMLSVFNTKPSSSDGRSRDRGQALVEFCLVIPLFLLLLCGVADFGVALFSRMTVINAAREGARASVMVTDHTTITNTAVNAAKSAAVGGMVTLTSDPVVTCLQTTVSLLTPIPTCNWKKYDASTNPTGARVGDSVRVTVNYDYKPFFPLLAGNKLPLSATVQMVIDS